MLLSEINYIYVESNSASSEDVYNGSSCGTGAT